MVIQLRDWEMIASYIFRSLQDIIFDYVLLWIQEFFVICVPSHDFLIILYLLQKDAVFILPDRFEKLASIVGVVGEQQVEKGWELHWLNFVYVEGVGKNDRDSICFSMFQSMLSDTMFGVKWCCIIERFQKRSIQARYSQFTMATFWYSAHERMGMPIKFMPLGNYNKKKSKSIGLEDRKSYNALWCSNLSQ